jgi:hypothetical protein
MDIDTKNERYPNVLVPILAQELNRILAKKADPVLSGKVEDRLPKANRLSGCIAMPVAKKSFEAYVTDPNGIFR